MSEEASQRRCWCGYPTLFPYSEDYHVCKACGTLVSRAPVKSLKVTSDTGELYSRDYWTKRQTEHHELPDIFKRARLDLPERCAHWLKHLLPRRLPPARILEVGCGHGGFLSLSQQSGYTVTGTEMSPWVVGFAQDTFSVDVLPGPIEEQQLEAGSFDVIALHDVLEHLPDPVGTFETCKRLLKPDGFFLIQTPEYKEHLTYADLQATQDLFLRHMDRNNEEHLYLFSRRSATEFFTRLGFPVLEFLEPVYPYDHYFSASRNALESASPDAVAAAMSRSASSRTVLALLDKAAESTDRLWAIRRLEAGQNR